MATHPVDRMFVGFRAVSSRVIFQFLYFADTSELEITFRSGTTYVYSGVPIEVWQEFTAAYGRGESLGSYFHHNVRQKYPSRKIDR